MSLSQINAYHANASIVFWVTKKGAIYFMGDDGDHGSELWKYDGTSGLSGCYAFAFNNTIYFIADDGVTGLELWRYDGENVSQVADINLGYNGSLPTRMRDYNNAYHFYADDGVTGSELWRLDPVSQLVRFTSVTRQGNNVALSWTSPGGMTNVLESTTGGAGGSFTNDFTDRSDPLVAPTGSVVTMNYLDMGGATINRARYWSLGAAGFKLQQADSLDSVPWSDNTNPVEIIGNSNVVTNDTPVLTRYFRLRR